MSSSAHVPTPAGWRIAQLAVLGTLACIVLSLAFNYLLLFSGLTSFGRGAASAFVLPVIISAPLFVFIGLKSREIGRYRRSLNQAATYDMVTECFKGAVFSSLVDRRAMPETGHGPRKGAFLLISAEQLNSINRRYGFDWGEEALRLIAATIRAAIRADDIVGRLADSEFAVFLPDASESSASEVGQRIRERVAEVVFTPKGGSEVLDVIVGGIIFEGAPGFDTMFRAAGQPLSDARRSGQVVLSRWNPEPRRSEWPAPLS